MTIALTWRNEDLYRETVLRLCAWGAIAGLAIFFISPPVDSRLGSVVAGFPALLAIVCVVARWRQGEGAGIVRLGFLGAMAFALTGAIAQFGWSRWYVDTLAAAPIEATLVGAAVGLIVSLGELPRCLQLVSRRVEVAARNAEAALRAAGQDEPADLVAQAGQRWLSVRDSLRSDPQASGAIEQAMMRLLGEASHWAKAAPGVALPTEQEMHGRLSRVDDMLERATDPVVRRQLEQARVAVVAQRRHLDEIAANRERALALMHRYVAAMERLHLAVLSARSVNATHRATVLGPIVDDLVALAEDMDDRQAGLDESLRRDARDESETRPQA